MLNLRKWLTAITSLLLIVIFPTQGNAGFFSPDNNRTSLIISGTPLVTEIVKILAESFKKTHPNVDIFVENSKNEIAYSIMKRGNIDIALTSVILSKEQDTLLIRGTLFARGSLVVVVNEQNKIENITNKQAHDIYVGKIKNWRELGGPFKPIKLILPRDGTVELDIIKQVLNTNSETPAEMTIFKNCAKPRLDQLASDDAYITIVRRKEFNSIKIGRALKIDGFEAKDQAILSQLYPLYIGYYMAVLANQNQLAKEFVDFTLSEEGQKIITEQGQISVQ